MNVATPLPDTHPQLSIVSYENSDVIEYRVTRSKPSRWIWMAIITFLAYFIKTQKSSIRWALIIVSVTYTWSTLNTIIWESVVAIPSIGIQLEVQRGFPATLITPVIPWNRTRRLIPLATILDVVINEGIRRWNFKYYLVVLHRVPPQKPEEEFVKMAVAFEDLLPPFPILKEIYHGVRETLFDEFEEPVIDQRFPKL